MTDPLTSLLQAGEGYHTEFKQSLDKSFVEEACAFANSGGGRILLGVTDNGAIKGIDTGNVMRSRVQDMLGQIEPRLGCEIEVTGNVLAVQIPEGTEKPYGCSRGFFMRMGANSQKLTRNQIIEFFQKEGRIRFDELSHAKAVYPGDFDLDAFAHFLKLAGISPGIERETLLRNLDCLTADNRLTNAGVLFFARDIDYLLNHAIVGCVLYKGTDKVHILDKKDFKANLVDNIDNAMLFIQRHTKLAYKIEHLRREEIPDYPEVALREAVVNAVCHRDYFDKRANVLIEVFADRVVITNPGGLPTGLSPEEFGTKSVARNPLIASLLHRIDYIEKIGTGISRIRQAVAEHGGTELDLCYNDFFTATFRAKAAISFHGKEVPEAHEGDQVETKSGPRRKETASKATQSPTQSPTQSADPVIRLLQILEQGEKSSGELRDALTLSHRPTFRNNYLHPALESGLIELTLPEKPTSSKQKYRLTAKGQALLQQESDHE